MARAAHKSPCAAREVLDFDLVLTLAAHREAIPIRGSGDTVTIQGAGSSEGWSLDQFRSPPNLLAQMATVATLKRGNDRAPRRANAAGA